MKYYRGVLAVLVTLFFGNCVSQKKGNQLTELGVIDKDGYVNLYNGKDMDNWNIMCRNFDRDLAKKVFTASENGEMHVFKNFPDGGDTNTGKSLTHCMFFTKEKYSKYSFKFEYKWGTKTYNNFNQFQYDAGMYYHVFDVKIWPQGIEYQVRYNHLENRNHTGDIWNSGAKFDWFADENVTDPKNKTYLSKADGGIKQEHRGGEHRAHKNAPFHALDGQWNQCEVIVMGNHYAIHKLNGMVVNVLTNLSLNEGIIGLQAETAEIFYRNMKIKEFKEDIPIERFLN